MAGTGINTKAIQRALAGKIVHEQIRLRYGDLQGKYASQERQMNKNENYPALSHGASSECTSSVPELPVE